MFIVDFLRRQKAIRDYVNHYMAPRRLALTSAQSILDGAYPEGVHAEMESQIGQWLAAKGHSHPNLIDVQLAMMELLITHFSKLLAASGSDYYQLVRSAYNERAKLRQVVDRLNELETQRDRLLSLSSHHDTIRLDATQGQVVMRRNRLIDAIY